MVSDKTCNFAPAFENKRAFSSVGLEHLPYKQRVGGSNPSTPTIPKTTIYVRTCKNQSCRCFLFYGKAYSLPYTEDAAYHLHIRQKWVSKNLVGIILVYFLPYIANTVLRNTTGYRGREIHHSVPVIEFLQKNACISASASVTPEGLEPSTQ